MPRRSEGSAKRAPSAKSQAILDAASAGFLRYGFRKTSMAELARAAGLSRQGLYLHFKTKEALFEAAVVRLVEHRRAQQRAALDRADLGLPERLLGAFEAIHGDSVGTPHSEHLAELLQTAELRVGPRVHNLERELIAAVADLLTAGGVAKSWKPVGVTAKDLAEHLYAASCGFKQEAKSLAAYRTGLRTAIKIVAARR